MKYLKRPPLRFLSAITEESVECHSTLRSRIFENAINITHVLHEAETNEAQMDNEIENSK